MDAAPEPSAPKRTRAKPKSAAKPTITKKPRTTRKPVPAAEPLVAPAMVEEPAGEDLGGMIAKAAYYLAAERNFTPGRELDDWLEAERRIRATQNG